MKLINWNVNGIRAVERKGALQALLTEHSPDLLLIQETKATPDKLSKELTADADYHQYYHSAQKPGYSGSSIWVKQCYANLQWSTGMPNYDDNEGRIARIDMADFSILCVYFPNGGKSKDAWNDKLVFYDRFLDYVNSIRAEGNNVIWAGDINCAHEEIDIARPKENQKSIGFLPEERAWVTKVIEHGWIDVFRKQNPEKVIYSWWSMVTKARLRNVGWRIDYFFVDTPLFAHVTKIEYLNDHMGSDHCPVVMEISDQAVLHT